MSIADNIKRFRKEAELTQKQLAEKTNLSVAAIQGYEQEKYEPKYETVQKLATALGVSIRELSQGAKWTFLDIPGNKRLTQKPKIVSDEEALICTTKLLDYAGCDIALSADEIRRITQITKDLHVSLINDIKENSGYIIVDN